MQKLVQVQDGGGLLADLVEGGQKPGVPAGLPVEGGVGDGHRQVVGQDPERGAGGGTEGLHVRTFDVEHAHQPVAMDEGNGQLRHHPREEGDVARVLGHVGDEDGLPELGGRAHDSLPGPQAELSHRLRGVPLDEGGGEHALRVGKEDVEDLVVDDAAELLGDGGEQLVGVEDGVDLTHQQEQLRQQLTGQGRTVLDALRSAHGPW